MVLLEKANSILVTDSLLNLQRMEQLLEKLDRPISREELGTKFVIWPTRHAGARELESKLKTMIERAGYPSIASELDESLIQGLMPKIEKRSWDLVAANNS